MPTREHFIKSFEIRNFRGITESGKIEFPEDSQWVFITGENRFGKTSILQALAVGLSGKIIKKGQQKIDLAEEAIIEVESISKKYSGKSGQFAFTSVCCYGSSRLNLASEDKFASNPVYNLFETQSYLKNIEIHLASWFNKRAEYAEFKERYESAREVLIRLLNIHSILRLGFCLSSSDHQCFY